MSDLGSSSSLTLIDPSLVMDVVAAIEFKLVFDESDIDNEEIAFKPKISHLVFADAKLYGYENLKISLYYTAASLKPYLNVSYTRKEEDATPEDIESTITSPFKCGFNQNIYQFKKDVIDDKDFRPIGEKIVDFNAGDDGRRKFVLYLASNETPLFPPYLFRMETFTLWFIDGANLTDSLDTQWKMFYLMEQIVVNDVTRYKFVGFVNVYEFYCYPEMIRPRISQVLILPPFSRMGLGAQLLKFVHMHYVASPQCRNITYEDPSDELLRVRWFVEASMCATLPAFHPSRLKSRLDSQMVDEAAKKFKLTNPQARTAFEILKFKSIKDERSEMEDFRKSVEQRITANMNIGRSPFTLTNRGEEWQESIREAAVEIIHDYKKIVERMEERPLDI